MAERNDSAGLGARLAKRIEHNWYARAAGNYWLLPLWLIFVAISSLRLMLLAPFRRQKSDLTPVIVIGNIAVGGTGKTPLITYLVERARSLGLRPAVVSRGYGGHSDTYPLLVSDSTAVAQCGDEPKLLQQRLQCPVVVDPKRSRAVAALNAKVDIIFSDDGLQHYAMKRAAEIVVSDVTRGFGNGWRLPIGPLREPMSRLQSADLHIVNGSDFIVEPSALIEGTTGRSVPLDFFAGQQVHAVAGIGNPQRFFTTLRALNYQPIEHAFPDHYEFTDTDLRWNDDKAVIMTEKDWVKCAAFKRENQWYLQVNAHPTEATKAKLDALLTKVSGGTATQS
ncbi:tetraacyldisaccharide 4'-kinase [Thalassolituus oleivorans]|uniref:Tetraacyldisaccharide 4'-kinase n=1 Tax=Thalassolituus oleivorans MIL-1 TaxID=1298593 RepID=M5DRZ6_9GAMM|nr:tetraacyldisaccharide 4'-kinase [Thalassolituus oleivorans]CCU72293.1 tetraacyldisaccharide 4'-kinase [Thalassolituus oleivorans MIL-1]